MRVLVVEDEPRIAGWERLQTVREELRQLTHAGKRLPVLISQTA